MYCNKTHNFPPVVMALTGIVCCQVAAGSYHTVAVSGL